MTVVVGGMGGFDPACYPQEPPAGGINGGAPGGRGASCGNGGGGGASDVRIGGTDLDHRVLVAGGGGGAANVNIGGNPANGGGGGGLSGEAGGPAGSGGSGGDQTGANGSGQLGVGSPGADGTPDPSQIFPTPGGGGGGGYYGGAGGQPDQGGGGSGFGPPGVMFETGVRAGDGLVTITYRTPLTFGGFRQPVDNPPTVNTGRAGKTYSVKFQIRDQIGLSYVKECSLVAGLGGRDRGLLGVDCGVLVQGLGRGDLVEGRRLARDASFGGAGPRAGVIAAICGRRRPR